jgi:predicted sulfurtransferase
MHQAVFKKIRISHTIHKDGEYATCPTCKQSVSGQQFYCNCGCEEVYDQPCFLEHYKNHAMKVSLERFRRNPK